VLAFSDSVMVNVPLESSYTRLQGSFDPIMSELSGMALCTCVRSPQPILADGRAFSQK
jgi:hypothetical protein